MTYQWGSDEGGQYNFGFQVRVSKGGPPYVPATITVIPDQGDWDQDLAADFAGTLKDALEGEGWTVDWVRQSGTDRRSLETASEE
jgi:hypothetical protein